MTGQLPGSESLPLNSQYPRDAVEQATLPDGTNLTIRPIRPEDAPRLQESFRRLSPESVFLRFLETFKDLPDQQAKKFSNLDYHKHMALIAELYEGGRLSLVGVARYSVVSDDEPDVAESAVVVLDEYQNRGLGKLLLNRLIHYARGQGIKTFVATIHLSNATMMHFVRRSGLQFEKRIQEPGVWEIRIHLAGENRQD